MNVSSPYQPYYDFLIEHVLTPFYQKRLSVLHELSLTSVLKRKNPYLFKAKNLELAGDFIKSIVDAFLSSQEETVFGNLLEEFAIFVSSTVDGGFKSKFRSVDLEFERDGLYYIVGIKSGTNWGNADQINGMKNNFKNAKESLRKAGLQKEIVAVNGCMYGTDPNPLKNMRHIRGVGLVEEEPDKVYYKYAGQDFWQFLSRDELLYKEIIVPIDKEAKIKDEAFRKLYTAKINEMTQEFMLHFMTNNQIDWMRLIEFVSKRKEQKTPPSA